MATADSIFIKLSTLYTSPLRKSKSCELYYPKIGAVIVPGSILVYYLLPAEVLGKCWVGPGRAGSRETLARQVKPVKGDAYFLSNPSELPDPTRREWLAEVYPYPAGGSGDSSSSIYPCL